MHFTRGFNTLERRFHPFEKGVHIFLKEGVHIYENNIIFIIIIVTLL